MNDYSSRRKPIRSRDFVSFGRRVPRFDFIKLRRENGHVRVHAFRAAADKIVAGKRARR